MSSFVHYNKFDKINDVPPKVSVNVPTTPTTTPSTTTTTTAATTTQSFSNRSKIHPYLFKDLTNISIFKACGVQSVLPKIIGGITLRNQLALLCYRIFILIVFGKGVAVNPYSWPWQVLLTIDRNDGYAEFCSGSLISNEWIGIIIYNQTFT